MVAKEDFYIQHLGEPTLPSPLQGFQFVGENAAVGYESDAAKILEEIKHQGTVSSFEMAGPRAKIFHDPSWSRAAILTAGGLCPGLNDVIKFLTLTLRRLYHVPIVYGIPYGFRGLNPAYHYEPILLDEDMVDDIHEKGGTILGSSRGREDEKIIVNTLERMNINMLFCIGGDGTSRCAHDVAEEVRRRGLSISVVCVPKTIDNDIDFIDCSFGFRTAVQATGPFVSAAHSEAKGAYNGIGLIKVMGRDSGFIAAYASLANSFVNSCLVPEVPFSLDENDPDSFLNKLYRRMEKKHHAVIVVAEGAGQELFKDAEVRKDASGNILKNDIGILLKERIKAFFQSRNTEVNIKYFDPSYTIRSVPAHGDDAVFCAMLAENAVHAAMSGCTDMVVGHWANAFTHVPIALATRSRKKIDPLSPLWSSLRTTGMFGY